MKGATPTTKEEAMARAWMAGWTVLGVLAALAAAPAGLAAQERLARQCTEQAEAAGAQDLGGFCALVAEAVGISQARAGIALAGGNPVPGTASTLGMRLGVVPRVSVAGRATGAWLRLPPIRRPEDDGAIRLVVPALAVDGALGVYQGVTLLPTVGGIGSLDLLASVGVIPLWGADFGGAPVALGAGARVGLLRESFTMPGISVSALYRRMGDVEFGDRDLAAGRSFFAAEGISGWSVRAAASKRILLLGITAGAGWDRLASDVALGVRDGAGGVELRAAERGLTTERATAFLNGSFTLLVVHVVGEVGWQGGGERPRAGAGEARAGTEDGALYGGLSVRLSI
jgi:hypothetical protein